MRSNERRFNTRYNKLKIPLRISPLGPQAPAHQVESADVSARGFYFESKLPFAVGTPLQITFRMPQEVAGRFSPEWICRGRVVRVNAAAESCGVAGVGVEIQYYEVSKDCRNFEDTPDSDRQSEVLVDAATRSHRG